MTGVQTCALPICFPVTIKRAEFSGFGPPSAFCPGELGAGFAEFSGFGPPSAFCPGEFGRFATSFASASGAESVR